jgi:hypothetical protein
MILAQNAIAEADISAELEVLAYTYDASDSIAALVRLDLGRSNPLAGSASYQINLYLNGVKVLPATGITASAGQTDLVANSREFTLIPGDVVSVTLIGVPADTGISVVCYLSQAAADKNIVKEAIEEALDEGIIQPGDDATLVSLDDVVIALRLGTLDEADEDYYQFLLNSAVAAIQRLTGRRFARATYTDYLDSRDFDEITLRETPVISITGIYEDRDALFGGDTLIDSTKYRLKLDGYSGDSESGIVRRINSYWNLSGDWSRIPGAIAYRAQRIPGCIKVVYVGGFASTPSDLKKAICDTVAFMRSTTANGAGFRGESDEGYSYTLNTADEDLLKIGSVRNIVANYRRFPV